MFAKITLFLLLFSTLLFAKTLPPSERIDSSRKHTSCHSQHSRINAMITFNRKDLFEFDFAVITKYRTFYPDILRYALQVEAWQISRLGKDTECGWHKARSSSPNNSSITSQWKAVADDHIPPVKGQLPSNETVDSISRILERNQPAGDVYELSTIILGYSSGFLAFLLLLVLVHHCAKDSDQPMLDTTKDVENVELSSITSQCITDFISAHRETTPAGVLKAIHTSTHERSMSSMNTIRSEPLPLYSVDQADR
ncbi:uncharacterized protein K460DRAFT_391462 [Cucurbitaria berberidis CBS 394.84]|uniref:Uncharacterized protein n=1 Tax=Cucurbitaria berberidis CBS 394.84 TaxID=1168544 RepID=A0A9P4GSQ9_9PLEO|nr:uncharacterized protein K460DRAFT_391462 [Cucurbitaria berberidis CBS 394.84]KAF1851117.1 hypothetical protein K460DRAFT_391462 [Cucurbitaria berberidis CBS 394.84]